jgi:2-keto-4-pentenoate hydratase
MTDSATDDKAAALVEAHRIRAPFVSLPADLLGDLGFAYAVQDRLVEHWQAEGEGTIIGWKIGFTTAPMQALAGVSEPAAGAILARRARSSGAELTRSDFTHLGLEGEIAVRIGEAFYETAPVDPALAFSRLESVAAAFEVTDDRNADWAKIEGASLVADNIWNMGVVLGPPTPAGALRTLVDRRGVVTVNGQVRDQGMSQDIGWDPSAIVAWVAAHLARRGRALRPGQWIMTGSFVPTTFPQVGDHYRFAVDGLEPVEALVV